MLKILILLLVATVCWAGLPRIVQPCKLNQNKCIGANLAANSYCKMNVRGVIPSKYVVNEFRFDTPYFNASYIDKDLIVRNHDKCFVSAFYYNTVTDKAVLGIDCPNLYLESDRVMIQHQSLGEDAYFYYHIRATYPLIRITVNLPSSTHMDLCQASVFTDVTQLPKLHVDPKDKPTRNFLTKDLTLLNIFEREAFFYYGYHLAKEYVDSILCDYGCQRELFAHKPLYKNTYKKV